MPAKKTVNNVASLSIIWSLIGYVCGKDAFNKPQKIELEFAKKLEAYSAFASLVSGSEAELKYNAFKAEEISGNSIVTVLVVIIDIANRSHH